MDQNSSPQDLAETRTVLADRGRRCFGAVAPERIADHILAVTADADWPVRKAALEALARRFAFAERDGLRVEKRPRSGVLGEYRTSRGTGGAAGKRPYVTLLTSLDPLKTSCGCADFVRSSLGLCKHGLTVLQAIARAKPPTPVDAERARAGAWLSWSPEHPLTGAADRLARIRYQADDGRRAPRGFHGDAPLPRVLGQLRTRLGLILALEELIRAGKVRAEPAVSTLLAEEAAQVARTLANQASSAKCLAGLSKLGRELYPYQREGVKRFFQTGRLLLADDMGLGKTTQAIAACHGLFSTGAVQRGLLIVPATLKTQWKREWQATTGAPLQLVEGSPEERARTYARTRLGFLVIGYEQLLRDFQHVQKFKPDLVVLDEAQRIKNWATKSAGYVKALKPAFRLVLTGTPMENRFDELASIMDFVDDTALEPKWRLAPWHSLDRGDGARGVMGARHLDTLRQRLSHAMLRRVRGEVLAQLPHRTDTRVPVEMTEDQREEHAKRDQPIAVLMSKAARRPLTQVEFLQLMQLLTAQRMICNGLGQLYFDTEWPRCQGHAPTGPVLQGLFAPKLSAFRDLVEQIVVGQRRKAVVFSQWRNMLKLAEWSVRDLLAEAGQRAVFFTGAETGKQREQAIVELHDDPGVGVMFLSDAGGVGLNLQRAATCCVNLEMPWNPAVLEQRIGRIHRLGQTHPIDVYNLVTEEGIEGRIATLVANKKAVFSSLFDGTTDEVRFDGHHSFLDSVKKLVDPVAPPPNAGDAAEDLAVEAEAAAEALQTAGEEAPPAAPIGEPTGLAVTHLPSGVLRIEAPPALAAPLADLLESLARSLRATAAPMPAAPSPSNGREGRLPA